MARRDASSVPVPVGPAGLGETRGAVPSAVQTKHNAQDYGTVIAFAAAPGKAALDGAPGGNSYYAAAVLRHLDAMAGEEFGTVMRMIAQEVYLKTSGRQVPWINESLRQLLYFGGVPAPLAGEEGDLLAERRQLLVTIAALPDIERRQVERVAERGGVSLDAVYGMLRALGSEVPDDPAKLEEVLRAEAERFAKVLAEREVVDNPDPEIARLTALADGAEQEGLLTTANTLRERAKARFREIEPTLEMQQAAIDQRYIEGAAVFARSAETKALAFNHLAAAADYAEAFTRVERRDAQLAWRYKNAEVLALTDHGNYKGDNAALTRAIEAGRWALRIAEELGDREGQAATQNNLGNALRRLGERERDTTHLEEAVVAYRAALLEFTRERVPLRWGHTQNNLGVVLATLGLRNSDRVRLEEAIDAYRAALLEITRERVPLDWAATQNNLGNALGTIGERESGTAKLQEAVDAYRAALEERIRERVPLDWAHTQNNLGIALWRLGEREHGTARLEEAVEAYRAALMELTRERVPLHWAQTRFNLGRALAEIGDRESGAARLKEAVTAYRATLEEYTRERVPLGWARTQVHLGNTLTEIGRRSARRAAAEEGRDAIAAAWEVYQESGYSQYDAYFQQRISEIDDMLAAME
ncbi:MAG: tetratricopeptide repeat protein [Rhizobiaceae bacterium]|nr:tetratricopeptide repeat protein [Rhizobiaceae bacterium]